MKQTQADGALFDAARIYRYALWRSAGFYSRTVGVIGLNPSTADERTDDATIRKLRHFMSRWGCDRLVMLNLFALRSTDPRQLLTADDPVGPATDAIVSAWLESCDLIVCAWGASLSDQRLLSRIEAVKAMLPPRVDVMCLGTTRGGMPKHPLYLPYWTPLAPYELPEVAHA